MSVAAAAALILLPLSFGWRTENHEAKQQNHTAPGAQARRRQSHFHPRMGVGVVGCFSFGQHRVVWIG